MERYVKYHEYSVKTAPLYLACLEKDDIVDLHKWSRQSLQTLHKLEILNRSVEYWV